MRAVRHYAVGGRVATGLMTVGAMKKGAANPSAGGHRGQTPPNADALTGEKKRLLYAHACVVICVGW